MRTVLGQFLIALAVATFVVAAMNAAARISDRMHAEEMALRSQRAAAWLAAIPPRARP